MKVYTTIFPKNKLMRWFGIKPKKYFFMELTDYATWSMDHTLSYIILPMLKQLRETKHGSPIVDDDDVPDELKSTSVPPREDDDDLDDKRWDWVLDEMIFAFEHKVDDSWEEKFQTGEIDTVWVPVDNNGNPVVKGEHTFMKIEHGPNHTFECDYDGIKLINKRMQNGFQLFGKYYRSLWD